MNEDIVWDEPDDDIVWDAPSNPTSGAKNPTKGNAPDFSNVSSRVTSSAQPRASKRTAKVRAQAEGEANKARIDYERMRDGPGFRAGAGYSLAQTGQGIRQLANDALMTGSSDWAGVADRVGLGGIADTLRRNVMLPAYQRGQQYRGQTADMRADMEPMQGSIAGQAGNIVGTAASMPGLGVARIGGRLAQLTAMAGQGAAMGAIQPVARDGERGFNMVAGGAVGGLGAGLPIAGRSVANAFKTGGLSRADRGAGGLLREALSGRQLVVEQSSVPGVQRTLADASRDDGVAALERNARRTAPDMFADIDRNNNRARVAALEKIAGDDAQIAAAKQARSQASEPLYAQARAASVPITPELQGIIKRMPASVLSKARQLAELEGGNASAAAGRMSGGDLHYIKLALDDEIGRVGPGSMGNTERALSMQLKDDFLGEVEKQIPAYGQASQTFRAMSKPISRMQLGADLIERGSAGVRDKFGTPRITPGTFAKANDLDKMAQTATGFKKSKAADILSPDDLRTISSIQDDLQRRFSSSQNVAQAGSATMEAGNMAKRATLRTLVGSAGRGAPIVGGAVEFYQNAMSEQLNKKLAFLLTNPAEAQRVLAALPAKERTALQRAMVALSGRTAIVGQQTASD